MKHIFWLLAIIALIAYCVIVWQWWEEGNRERQSANATGCIEFLDYPREQTDKIPMACMHKWVEVNIK